MAIFCIDDLAFMLGPDKGACTELAANPRSALFELGGRYCTQFGRGEWVGDDFDPDGLHAP